VAAIGGLIKKMLSARSFRINIFKTNKYRNLCILPDASLIGLIYMAKCEVPDQTPPWKGGG